MINRGVKDKDVCRYSVFLSPSDGTMSLTPETQFIALVPHDVLASFLKCDGEIPPGTLEPLMAFFARSSMRPGASKCVLDTLLHLSRQLEFIEAISGKTLALCLKAFVQFGEFEYFRAAVMHHQSTLPLSFFEWLRGWIVASPDKALERFMNIRQGYVSIKDYYSDNPLTDLR